MKKLYTGKKITCPMGRSGLCGSGVLCRVENNILQLKGPTSDERHINQHCTDNFKACYSYKAYKETGMTQYDSHKAMQEQAAKRKDYRNEQLEPYMAVEDQ